MPVLPGSRRCPTRTALIVARGELGYAVLNLYPYNPGHLMVGAVPPRRRLHRPDRRRGERGREPHSHRDASRCAQWLAPHGFNIGMNQGTVAGAGIAAHLHQHVVPRWGGDTNFIPVVAHTRVLPQLLSETRQLLADGWSSA